MSTKWPTSPISTTLKYVVKVNNLNNFSLYTLPSCRLPLVFEIFAKIYATNYVSFWWHRRQVSVFLYNQNLAHFRRSLSFRIRKKHKPVNKNWNWIITLQLWKWYCSSTKIVLSKQKPSRISRKLMVTRIGKCCSELLK